MGARREPEATVADNRKWTMYRRRLPHPLHEQLLRICGRIFGFSRSQEDSLRLPVTKVEWRRRAFEEALSSHRPTSAKSCPAEQEETLSSPSVLVTTATTSNASPSLTELTSWAWCAPGGTGLRGHRLANEKVAKSACTTAASSRFSVSALVATP